jgi:glutamate/tyrosine decarboxylase-like PLP-dependent enzyme
MCLAFGIFARVLPEQDDYKTLHKRVEGIELADSITVDGHKLLNVVSLNLPLEYPLLV